MACADTLLKKSKMIDFGAKNCVVAPPLKKQEKKTTWESLREWTRNRIDKQN